MRVLIGCEYTGVLREAFRSLGHDAWSCDLRESLISSPYHYQGDADSSNRVAIIQFSLID